jgi:hypothetical protein
MTRRGLTIIEVVAATVLLTSLAIAVVPVIRDAQGVIDSAADVPDLLTLSELADEISEDPKAFHLEPALGVQTEFESVLAGHVRVRTVVCESDHAWILVDANGAKVCRYVRLESEESP